MDCLWSLKWREHQKVRKYIPIYLDVRYIGTYIGKHETQKQTRRRS